MFSKSSRRKKYNQIEHSKTFINKEQEYKIYLNKITSINFICCHKGYGLVACKDIDPFQFIGFYRGSSMSEKDGNITLQTFAEKSFLFFLSNGTCLDGDPSDPISLANDSRIFNSVMKPINENLIGLFATAKGIESGKEISYSYEKGFPVHMPWRKNKPLSFIFDNDKNFPLYKNPTSVCHYCKSEVILLKKTHSPSKQYKKIVLTEISDSNKKTLAAGTIPLTIDVAELQLEKEKITLQAMNSPASQVEDEFNTHCNTDSHKKTLAAGTIPLTIDVAELQLEKEKITLQAMNSPASQVDDEFNTHCNTDSNEKTLAAGTIPLTIDVAELQLEKEKITLQAMNSPASQVDDEFNTHCNTDSNEKTLAAGTIPLTIDVAELQLEKEKITLQAMNSPASQVDDEFNTHCNTDSHKKTLAAGTIPLTIDVAELQLEKEKITLQAMNSPASQVDDEFNTHCNTDSHKKTLAAGTIPLTIDVAELQLEKEKITLQAMNSPASQVEDEFNTHCNTDSHKKTLAAGTIPLTIDVAELQLEKEKITLQAMNSPASQVDDEFNTHCNTDSHKKTLAAGTIPLTIDVAELQLEKEKITLQAMNSPASQVDDEFNTHCNTDSNEKTFVILPNEFLNAEKQLVDASELFQDINMDIVEDEVPNECNTQDEMVMCAFQFSDDCDSENGLLSQIKAKSVLESQIQVASKEDSVNPIEIHFHEAINENGIFDQSNDKTFVLKIDKNDSHIYFVEKLKKQNFSIVQGSPPTTMTAPMTAPIPAPMPSAPNNNLEDCEVNDMYKICPIDSCHAKIKILSEHLKTHKIDKERIRQYCREQRRRAKKSNSVRFPRKCPLEQCARSLPYRRLDQHLRVVHKMNPHSSEYRSLIRKRAAPDPFSRVVKKIKGEYSDNAQKYSMEFFDFMRSFSGGHEPLDNAKIVAGQVRQVINCLNEIDMLDIACKKVITKLESFFTDFNEDHKGSSGQTYSSNFLRFLKFYHTKYPERLSSSGLASYDVIIKNWKKVFAKHKKMDQSEKSDIEITVEEIAFFEASQYYREVVTEIESLTEDTVNLGISLHRKIRDFLCLNLLLWNAARSGPIYNMTESEYRKGKNDTIEELEMFTVGVRTHKTIYRNCVRPRPETIKVNNRTDKPIFIRWSGAQINHSDLYNGVKKIWTDAGMTSKIGSTVLRHFTVDESHEFMAESGKADLAYKMCHSLSTAYNRYKAKLKTANSARSSVNIHETVSGKLRATSSSLPSTSMPSTSRASSSEENYFTSEKYIETQTNANLTKGLHAPGKGNRTFLDSERKIIYSTFNKWIADGVVPSRSIIRDLIASENLGDRIGDHATEKSVWGCLMNFKNKHPKNKMKKGQLLKMKGKSKSSKK